MSITALLTLVSALGIAPAETARTSHLLKFQARQEIIWHGRWEETTHRNDVKTHREFHWEVTLIILEPHSNGCVAAMLTNIQQIGDVKSRDVERIIHSNITLLWLDHRGSILKLSPSKWLEGKQFETQFLPPIPIEGLPTIDCSMFLELPSDEPEIGDSWDVFEAGRAYRTWKVEKIDFLRGSKSLEVQGKQQSPQWHLGNQSKRTTWERTDIAWIAEHGYASKIDRTIQVRDPDSLIVNVRTHMTLEQKQIARLSREAHRERCEEIEQALEAGEALQMLIPEAGREVRAFETLLKRLTSYTTRYPAREDLPYREAIRDIQRRAESARDGHVPPILETDDKLDCPCIGLARDHLAPDFLATAIGSSRTVRLHHSLGKAVVLFYFQPQSDTSNDLLRFADQLQSQEPEKIRVLAIAMGNHALALEQLQNLKLKIPILSDREVRRVHTVESTPEIVVLDSQGIVRFIALGWGKETTDLISKSIERCTKHKD